MNPYLLLLLYVLAVHRVSRLLTVDEIPLIAVPRDLVRDYFGVFDPDGKLVAGRQLGVVGWSIAYVLTCPWCMSVYVGAALVFVLGGWVSTPLPWLWVAAGSTVTGLLSGVLESEHELRYQKILAEIDNLRSRR